MFAYDKVINSRPLSYRKKHDLTISLHLKVHMMLKYNMPSGGGFTAGLLTGLRA
jgi:hypothetical protein